MPANPNFFPVRRPALAGAAAGITGPASLTIMCSHRPYLNHLNLGFTRFKTTIESYSVDQDWPTQLGLTGVNTGPNNSFPCIDFISSGYKSLGDSICNSRTLQTNNSFQAIESFSVIRGTHSFKFGGDFRFMETNGIDIYQANGVFQFNALETGLPGNPTTGNAVASFLLGA